MRKIFNIFSKSLLTGLLMVLMGSVAWSQTLPTSSKEDKKVSEPAQLNGTGNSDLYPYDPKKAVVDIDAQLKQNKPVELFAPNHPGNKTIEEGKQQAEDNKRIEEQGKLKEPGTVPR